MDLGGDPPVSAPEPGDLAFRDHISEMLARLPEQFKEKRPTS